MNAPLAPKSLHPAIKWMAVLLLFYSFLMGWLGDVPRKVILNEVRYLLFQQFTDDTQAQSLGLVGLLFGFLGLVTGMVWAQFTWGAWWSGDPKQNASAVGLLLYLAYMVLRSSFEDAQRRARMAAVYNVLRFFV